MNPKTIPGTEKLTFKDAFIERYSGLTDWEEYKKYSLSFVRKAIRVNTLKISVKECVKRIEAKGWKLEQIPWCKEGFWILHDDRRDVGNLWEHHMGYFYVQEAASMIPPVVLGASSGDAVLDMAASPGSKSTQIAAMMENSGVLVANDVKGIRLAALGVNVQRVGASNIIVSQHEGQRIRGLEFDKILLDAPCSGTGTIGKSLKTIDIWNPDMVKRLCIVQKQLFESAWKLLKKGGTLVYSTCTLEPEEDEGVISAFIEAHDDAEVDVISDKELPGLKRSDAVMSFNGVDYHPDVKKCLRIWPQDNYTEGFFVARLKKKA
jgi:tRNA (cytosine49-C5)-methyltransferase